MVGDSAKTLKRFHFLLRECVLAEAGWMPGTTHWETKLLWPEFAWQDALTAGALRDRVLELRYPERRVEPGDDEPLLAAWRTLLRGAPNDAAFAMAMAEEIKPFIDRLYRRYLELADTLDDAPTVRFLRQARVDVQEQIARLIGLRNDREGVYPPAILEAARLWTAAVRHVLADVEIDQVIAGNATLRAPAGAAKFAIARRGRRDPRFLPSFFWWPNSYDPDWKPKEGLELQMHAAVQHCNEVWAAEMAAAVLFDLGEEGPPEFLQDAARWCFDEIRHCRMGYSRLIEWGFTKGEIPLGTFSYDAGAELDALGRLGIIFYFETTYIHTKPERAKLFAESGDRLSSHDMDFDWADELIHTHYGKKWLAYFAERRDPKPSLQDIKLAGEEAVRRIRAEASEADRERVLAAHRSVMKRAEELAIS